MQQQHRHHQQGGCVQHQQHQIQGPQSGFAAVQAAGRTPVRKKKGKGINPALVFFKGKEKDVIMVSLTNKWSCKMKCSGNETMSPLSPLLGDASMATKQGLVVVGNKTRDLGVAQKTNFGGVVHKRRY